MRTFERGDELARAEVKLAELEADVAARENSPAAHAEAERRIERKGERGLYDKWSLDLNPTPAWVETSGMSARDLVQSVPEKMTAHAAEWRAQAPDREKQQRAAVWQPTNEEQSVFRAGGLSEDKQPGAQTEWDGREWRWSAWDGHGGRDSGSVPERVIAQHRALESAKTLAKDAEVDADVLSRPPTLGAPEPTRMKVDPEKVARDAHGDPLDLSDSDKRHNGRSQDDYDLGGSNDAGPEADSGPSTGP